MSVVRYEPWSAFRKFHDEVNRLFDDRGSSFNGAPRVAARAWTPAVDVREEDTQFVVTADVPGVDPKDIEVTVDNGVLSIKGERSHESKNERNGYKHVERAHGSFHRRFSLPESADAEAVKASGKNGVLEITIPKVAQVQPRRIEVH